MSKRSDKLLTQDILQSILDIKEFTKGMKYVEFAEDSKTHKAVLYSHTVIDEAINKLSPHLLRQIQIMNGAKLFHSETE